MSNEGKPPLRPCQVRALAGAGICVPALGAKRAELALLVNSRNPIVTVETTEEEDDAMRVLRQAVLARHKADAGLLDDVLEAKRQAIDTGGLLETMKRDASFADVAGLERLRDWIGKRKSALTPEGQRFGLVPPKGVLITGAQGCGKSLRRQQLSTEILLAEIQATQPLSVTRAERDELDSRLGEKPGRCRRIDLENRNWELELGKARQRALTQRSRREEHRG